MTIPALALRQVERVYRQAGQPLAILRGVDFELFPGQSVALIAPSGTGKSTLLHVAGLLEKPDAGLSTVAAVFWRVGAEIEGVHVRPVRPQQGVRAWIRWTSSAV